MRRSGGEQVVKPNHLIHLLTISYHSLYIFSNSLYITILSFSNVSYAFYPVRELGLFHQNLHNNPPHKYHSSQQSPHKCYYTVAHSSPQSATVGCNAYLTPSLDWQSASPRVGHASLAMAIGPLQSVPALGVVREPRLLQQHVVERRGLQEVVLAVPPSAEPLHLGHLAPVEVRLGAPASATPFVRASATAVWLGSGAVRLGQQVERVVRRCSYRVNPFTMHALAMPCGSRMSAWQGASAGSAELQMEAETTELERLWCSHMGVGPRALQRLRLAIARVGLGLPHACSQMGVGLADALANGHGSWTWWRLEARQRHRIGVNDERWVGMDDRPRRGWRC